MTGAETAARLTVVPMRERKNPWGDELPAPAKVVPYVVAFIVLVVAVGLAGQSANTTQDDGVYIYVKTARGDESLN